MSVSIKLSGPFSDEDIAAFARLLREIDQRNPTGIYTMTLVDPERGMDASEALLRQVLPPMPDRATSFARAAYRDDSYPERRCDRCEQPYRGPAVYCSLDCALADAA